MWKCSEGHVWEAAPGYIKRGRWCPYCAGTKKTIQDMQTLAEKKGGKCFSEKYIKAKTKLKWECSKGHTWEATPDDVNRNKWCPHCAGDLPLKIENMMELAKLKGGECLSKVYINARTKLNWKCGKGHEWEATPDAIKRGSWCPSCAGKNKTIKDMQNFAKTKQGKCLSKKYINAFTKLEWECKEGHRWKATPGHVLHGKWCPVCGGSKKLTIEEMHLLAEIHGGQCLSKKYTNSRTHLRWQCKEGHTWEAIPSSVKKGHWCPKCGDEQAGDKKRLSIEEMREIAISRGGECLSEKYIDANTKLIWKCIEGHEWQANPGSVKAGHWCSICAKKKNADAQRKSIEDMREIAKERQGKCLSTEYINSHSKLIWQCKRGHTWEAEASRILSGSWCPDCSSGVSERICRKYFEAIFNEKFPKRRPTWLKIGKRKRLELDGYCKNLALAFEYQGLQHYKHIEHFHSKADFKKRQHYDRLKRKLCKEHSVTLIEVSYKIEYEEMGNYIIEKCKEAGVNVPELNNELNYKLFDIYSSEELISLNEIAESKGGKCLSKGYINTQTKLKWQCKEMHEWEATPNDIKSGNWCPYCGCRIKLTLEEMIQIAESRGGKCLSDTYINAHTKLYWECKEGHIWETTPDKVKRGSWCPYCAGILKATIDDMHKLAEAKGGKCLSENYENNTTKLKWECKEGHIWEAIPSSIKRGSWCPDCCNTKKQTIQNMKQIAKSKNGQCLSEEYLNSKTKLKWECKEGHTWKATPGHILRGKWCPHCAGNAKLDIETMKQLAKSKGGICLSEKYINSKTPLLWKCAQGHEWEATPGVIKGGSWCPYCSGRKKTIKDMQVLAEKKGGKCLSQHFVKMKTKLEWQCMEGHTWLATPDDVISA